MCEQCQGFSTRFRVDAGREYHDLIRQLRDLTQSCVFKLLSGTVPLEEVLTREVWHDELLVHIFECTKCGRQFELKFDTGRGRSAVWQIRYSDAQRSIQ